MPRHRIPVVLVACAWLAACGPDEGPPPFEGFELRPTRGYVFVSFDALRADHLGAYGYHRPTSPFFDSLAERGILFERAYAPYPATLVSNISLFTGLYPNRHSVYPPSSVLSDRVTTLPEHLAAHGFRTEAHTEGGYMAGGFGFARGFERYTEKPHESEDQVERTFGMGTAFLEGLGRDERFFLLLHTYSTHDPYHPPPDYDSLYWDTEPPAGVPDPTGANLRSINHERLAAGEGAAEYYAALYDATIRYADDVLRSLFQELDRLDLADETTVVVTADHGEEFREHGKFGHTQVYPETLRIPLLVVHPDLRRGVRVPWLVSVVDVAPTLVELAGLPAMEDTDGRSLAPLLSDPPSRLSGEAYGEAIDEAAVRTLFVEEEDRLFQLKVTEPNTGEEDVWVTLEATFETVAPEIRFEIQSYHRPRTVRLLLDGEEAGSLEVDTTWQERSLRLPAGGGLHAVTLATDACEVPAMVERSEDTRCLSFQLRGMPLRDLELYDLTSDPLAADDISRERPDLVARLLDRMDTYGGREAFEPESTELSAEELDRLRALGYLD